MYILIQK